MNQRREVVLAINPGSTSTKLGLWSRTGPVATSQTFHDQGELGRYASVAVQLPARLRETCRFLAARSPATVRAVVGRGGLLRPLAGGTYIVDSVMLEELAVARWGEHAANLGAPLAAAMAAELGVPAYIVDPVVVDELHAHARISGWPNIERRSVFHALNQKAAARRAAAEIGRPYSSLALVVAHLGGGITVGAHLQGLVVDVNNGLDGEGPFSPERSGGLPVTGLIRLVARGTGDRRELLARVAGRGGLMDHLGTNDAREAETRAGHDGRARLVLEALAFQVAKEIGRAVASLGRRPAAIVLTGGLARSQLLVEAISGRVRRLAERVLVYAGEDELAALAAGAWRVLDGAEEARNYG